MTHAGSSHPRVRQFLNVKHNRGRNAPGAIALEGLWAIQRAVEARVPIEVVFVCPALRRGDEAAGVLVRLRARGVIAFEVSERVLRHMVDRDGPDGLAAIAYRPQPALTDIVVHTSTRVVVADAFELAGNLGAVIRCADGAGAGGVIVTDRRIRIDQPRVLKASMGTLLSMPVVDVERAAAIDWLRRRGLRLVVADPAAPTSYRDANYAGPIALVLGSERHGVAPIWRDAADTTVAIPMRGIANSLNVGHAAALLLYEALHAAGV